MFSGIVLLALGAAPLALAQHGAISHYADDSESVSASRYEGDGCESNSYYINGYVSNGQQRMLNIEASYSNYCDDNDYISFYACANLRVPDEATWVKENENTAVVKAKATLNDCGYYSYGSTGTNPLVGVVMEVDVEIYCKVLEESKSACLSRNTGRSGFNTGHNVYSYSNCYVDGDVGTVTIDGVKKTLESGSFGTSKSRDVNVSIPRPRLR